MKKFLSVFFAIVLIFSAFSLNAFAAETTRIEEWGKEHFPPYELGAKVTINDETIQTFYIKDKMIAGNVPVSENINIDIIMKEDCTYLYFKAFPYFHLKFEDVPEDYLNFDSIDLPEASFDGSGTVILNSEEYYVEQFIAEDGTIVRYFFDGNDLKYIEAEDYVDGYYNHTIIEILTTEVDDEVFELPFFSINLAPLIDFVFVIMM